VTYSRLAVTPSDPARRDAVSAALFVAGAGGVLEEGDALISVFETGEAARDAARAASTADASAIVVCDSFEPGDYLDAWRRGVRAHRVGDLVVAPPWLAHEHDPARTIIIDPGTGFGTGEHESTRLALAHLHEAVRPGDVVADAGCGSGVLAIAAARLGAARVAAIESDAEAVVNAEANIALNAVGGAVTLLEADVAAVLPLLSPVRVIVANILATVIEQMMPVFRHALARDGALIVSGILVSERDAFAAAVDSAGWRIASERTEGEWWSATLRRDAA
jgi:ribosomal protein L11 methyltransferase